ncbi:MAG: preprotein translocase subunit SecG [Verrucomicrobiia bacterium]
MSILIGLLTAVHILVALFVILLVLMQKSSEQGVGAAFGGGMTETVFGAGTTTALVRMTIWCAGLLLATTLILAVLHSHRTRTGGSLMRRTLATMPAAPAAPAGQAPAFPFTSQSTAPAAPNTGPTTPSTATPAPAAPAQPAPTTPQSSPAPTSP